MFDKAFSNNLIFACFFKLFEFFFTIYRASFQENVYFCRANVLELAFSRHIEESAFRLFLLRKLDTYKSNMGIRRKTLFLVCIRYQCEIQPSGVVHSTYLYYEESNLTQLIRRC